MMQRLKHAGPDFVLLFAVLARRDDLRLGQAQRSL
jgi:hypothetical protein